MRGDDVTVIVGLLLRPTEAVEAKEVLGTNLGIFNGGAGEAS
jgi:hypothetical protein